MMKEKCTDKEFNISESAWNASFVLKASFWSCNIVHFKISQKIRSLKTSWRCFLEWPLLHRMHQNHQNEHLKIVRALSSWRCFQNHLKAQKMIFKDKTRKWAPGKLWNNEKKKHFWPPILRKWWPFCFLSTRFISTFELFISRFYVLGVFISVFQEC